MRYVRNLLIIVALLFAFAFLLPMALHTLICDELPFGPCPKSPYLPILEFLSDHRGYWMVLSGVYALVVFGLFRRDVGREFRKTFLPPYGRRILLTLAAVVIVVCVLGQFVLSQ